MLRVQGVSYSHPDGDTLFRDLNFSIQNGDKIALIGNNGVGKSTLLRLIAGELLPAGGSVISDATVFYMPQHFGQFDHLTIAEAMGVGQKIEALRAIVNGDMSDRNVTVLADDWTIEERCIVALQKWSLHDANPDTLMGTLSGGQKTRVFLAAMDLRETGLILMDEPTNHLDTAARTALYHLVDTHPGTFIIVSHDRTLLDRMDYMCEISADGIRIFGGNYTFYREQKSLEKEALEQDLKGKEKAVRKARSVSRETIERQQKLDARGKRKQEKAGVPTIMMNTLRNNAEKTGSKLKTAHSEKIGALSEELEALRKKVPDADQMKLGFDRSHLHTGKRLFTGEYLNFRYDKGLLWDDGINLEIMSGDRIAIWGRNGSGKTTLIKMLRGELEPASGNIYRADFDSVYIDQDYSLINNGISVYEQAENYNTNHLLEHEVKIRLNRFLFLKDDWDKSCAVLSGGEKMRLALCCLNISSKAPDMIILDEPTNNLDIQNLQILAAAIKDYTGTLVVVSHDKYFLQEVLIERIFDVDNRKFI